VRLDGKVVIVTGAAGAQGTAITRRMLDEGATVIAADARDDALAQLRDGLTAGTPSPTVPPRLALQTLDVTDEVGWQTVVDKAIADCGRLDGLVHAAAILNRSGVESTELDVWRRVTDVNVVGTGLAVKHVAGAMRSSGGGSIVLISSIDGIVGRGTATAYHASKGAVRQIARTTAVELADAQIRVNTVCPGAMADKMALIADVGEPPSGLGQATPLGRLGVPDDIAWACVYLISDESSFVTGTDLVVDGGYTAR